MGANLPDFVATSSLITPRPEDSSKDRTMVLNMGPQHPSTHGVLRLVIEIDGETVLKVVPDIGYLHTGIEKTCEAKFYQQVVPMTDRIDYLSPMTNNLCYVLAVEKLLQIEIPDRAQWIRVLFNELTRLNSHLVWLGTHAMDIGALTVFLYCFREREEILRFFEAVSGQRMMTSYFRVGGLSMEPPLGLFDRIRKLMKVMPEKIDEYQNLLTGNPIWVSRLKGVGHLSAADAIALGVTGPVLRASGVQWDLRKAQPYAAYGQYEFDIPTRETGDTYDRYVVRMEEMRQSRRICLQAVENIPTGPIMARIGKVLKPPPGEVYHSIEAPKGELGYYIVSDGTTQPYRVRVRPPSFINLQAFDKMAKGSLIADVVAIIGTIDIVLGEVDR